jgi:sensor histidine kinase YesM
MSTRSTLPADSIPPRTAQAYALRRMLWRNLLFTLGLCSLLSLLFMQLSTAPERAILMTFTVGLSVFAVVHVSFSMLKPSARIEPLIFVLAVLVGSGLGLGINLWARPADELDLLLREYPDTVWRLGALLVVVTSVVAGFFFTRERANQLEIAYHTEQAKNHAQQRLLVEAQLKMLQAQIEPHFLFNTLANVQSLIDASPAQAKAMLGHFNDYLRASLWRTRAGGGRVREELDLLRAYLAIQQMRMPGRLAFEIDCPDALLDLPLPPMLVQPLVENAVRHGIEPQVNGGRIVLKVAREDRHLRISVQDDGAGIQANAVSSGSGLGLANVRERLRTRYGPDARLQLGEIQPHGFSATLLLPLDTRPGADT